jgi:hypothetical protein
MRRGSSQQRGLGRSRWVEYLIAILAGNAIYFLLLMPRLPEPFRHRTFQVDWGLAVDFMVCLGFYGLIRWYKRL